MSTIDWLIVAVVTASAMLGVFRGLVREVFSVIGWVTGIILALRFAVPLGDWLPSDLAWQALRTSLAALALIVTSVFAAAIAGWALHKLLAAAHLSGTDRMLGAVFGVLRGVLIVFVAVLFISRTAVAQQPAWRGSVLLPPFDAGVRLIAPHLPELLSVPATAADVKR
jgi:membrane protein required for colicin V production